MGVKNLWKRKFVKVFRQSEASFFICFSVVSVSTLLWVSSFRAAALLLCALTSTSILEVVLSCPLLYYNLS